MMARRGPLPSHGRASCAHDFFGPPGEDWRTTHFAHYLRGDGKCPMVPSGRGWSIQRFWPSVRGSESRHSAFGKDRLSAQRPNVSDPHAKRTEFATDGVLGLG